ncbi:MAG: glutamate--tRNA ligase [Candidatus Kerfeldbacteria bacterium]|nr:glutamate--tRNA ligase [Candidatus Kerfeldbacteria bacterium]
MNTASLVRVRLAPSPTGEVHIGTIWVGLFNWLFARQHSGTFVLRIEDTDRKRLVLGSPQRIEEALDWYGLTPDEGPRQGGPYGPYVQSQRLDLYQRYAAELLDRQKAYYCFCTPARLETLRQQQQAAKLPPRYDKHCTTLTSEAVARRRSRGESAVVRINLPTHGSIVHHDLIRQRVAFRFDQLDDSVILKSDGFPTYHLAVVVDDHLMAISHVIRAEEWLPSVPKHLWLYQALRWTPPKFAHVPLILGSDRKKLSKRHGAMPALAWRDQGYRPEAMRNFLVLMGWHPKGDEEVLSTEEMVKQFHLEDVNPAAAIFDQRKLDWFNGWYLRHLSDDELWQAVQPFWRRPGSARPRGWELRALGLAKDRFRRLTDVDELMNVYFSAGWDEDLKRFSVVTLVPQDSSHRRTAEALRWVRQWLSDYQTAWGVDALRRDMMTAIARVQRTNVEVLWPLRVALTLRAGSPDVFSILSLLGHEETVRRLDQILTLLDRG